MRTLFYTVAVPILTAAAFAQDTQPPQAKQQPAESAAPPKSEAPEAKTQTYSGTLVDATCAAPGADTTSTPPSTTAASSTDSSTSKSSANRSAGPGSEQSCSVSASTTQFAVKTKDGKVMRFDDVGNTRVKEAMKTRKSWSDSVSANKPIKVKASGLMSGDKLIVVAVD
jgi:hypothetical protein